MFRKFVINISVDFFISKLFQERLAGHKSDLHQIRSTGNIFQTVSNQLRTDKVLVHPVTVQTQLPTETTRQHSTSDYNV